MGAPKFLIQGRKNPSTIYVRYSVSRNIDIKVKTQWTINPADWSKSKGKVKNSKDDALKKLQNKIDALKSKIIDAYNLRDDDSEITANWLRRIVGNFSEVREGSDDVIPKLVIPYIDYYIKQKEDSGKVTDNTIKSYKSFKKRILNFQNDSGIEFRFKEIDLNFQSKFTQFSKKLNYGHNGTQRIMKWLKQVVHHAASNRIEISPQIDQIPITNDSNKLPMVYLTPEEINKIASEKMPHEYLDNARDWLIIGCETGQRVSDYLKFAKSQTFNPPEAKERTFIKFVQQKTGKLMEIPLTPRVMKILEKRNGNFPRRISDVKFNEYIKTVAELAKINTPTLAPLFDAEKKRNIINTYPKFKLITSKVARRSFCTNNYGVKETTMIMYMSGHTTEKALLDYIGTKQSAIRENLSKNW